MKNLIIFFSFFLSGMVAFANPTSDLDELEYETREEFECRFDLVIAETDSLITNFLDQKKVYRFTADQLKFFSRTVFDASVEIGSNGDMKEAALSVIDAATEFNGLDVATLAEAINDLGASLKNLEYARLKVEHEKLEGLICLTEAEGYRASQEMYVQYNVLHAYEIQNGLVKAIKAKKSYRMEVLNTVGSLVQRYSNKYGEFVQINLQQEDLDIATAFPAEPYKNQFKINSPYGYRIHPIYKVWKDHKGLDISRGTNAPITAIASGYLKQKKGGGHGNRVIIEHPQYCLRSSYSHGSKYIGNDNRYVESGETILLEGETGDATGVHTHLEISYIDSQGEEHHINPFFLFKGIDLDVVSKFKLYKPEKSTRKDYDIKRARIMEASKSIDLTNMQDALYLQKRPASNKFVAITKEEFEKFAFFDSQSQQNNAVAKQ